MKRKGECWDSSAFCKSAIPLITATVYFCGNALLPTLLTSRPIWD